MVLFENINVDCDPSTRLFVSDLTSSYVDQSNEASMVAASVIMFVLAGVFFNLNLFSGISDVSAILDPKVRIVLSSALSLLLPVMSYLFSEAKNAGRSTTKPAGAGAGAAKDLPLQALVILVWMLLVELLRKKVDEIRMKGISSSLQRAGRVVWLGSLVFFNVRSAGRKIIFGVLWILCATTVLQRIAFTEFGKRSYAHGKNARLVASYMAWILGHVGGGSNETSQAGAAPAEHAVPVVHHGAGHDVEHAAQRRTPDDGQQLLKTCRYIVVGEDQLVKEATADGYDLNVDKNGVVVAPGFVTVGDVWSLPGTDSTFAEWDGDQRLRRLCLSFALFKLLRGRFEQHEPLTEEEANNGRELILRGLYYNKVKVDGGHGGTTTTTTADSEAVFQVITDDVNFLSEYYHSVVPVIPSHDEDRRERHVDKVQESEPPTPMSVMKMGKF